MRRRKWNLLLPALAVFGLASAAAFLLPPTYVSTTTIQIEQTEVPGEYAADGPAGFADRRLRAISRRVLSTQKLIDLVNRFRLYEELKGRKPIDEIVGKFRDDIGFSAVEADIVAPRSGHPASATIAFTVGYKGRRPETVRRVAAGLASLYLEEDVRARERRAADMQGIFEAGMKAVQEELASLDGRIADYRSTHLASMPERAQANLRELDRLDREVERTQELQGTLRERESYLRDQLEGISPENLAHIVLSTQLAGARAELDATVRAIRVMEKRRGAYQRRIDEGPRVEKEYRAMAAERDELQLKHDDLARKAAETRIAFEIEKERHGERFTIVEAARLPGRPSSPNIPAILLIGLVLGLGSGVAYAAWMEASDKTAHNLEQVAAALPFPALVSIPYIAAPGDGRRRKAEARRPL